MNTRAAVVAMALSLCATLAHAQYPERPVTMIVPFPPGGLADTVGRPVAEGMTNALKQPVVIENKAGAGGAIGMAYVAKAKPDGYTVLMALSSLVVLPEADRILGRAPSFQVSQLKPVARFTADPAVTTDGGGTERRWRYALTPSGPFCVVVATEQPRFTGRFPESALALFAHGRTPFRAAIGMALVDVAMLVWAR